MRRRALLVLLSGVGACFGDLDERYVAGDGAAGGGGAAGAGGVAGAGSAGTPGSGGTSSTQGGSGGAVAGGGGQSATAGTGGVAAQGGSAGGIAGAGGSVPCGPLYTCDADTAFNPKTGLRWRRNFEPKAGWLESNQACAAYGATWRIPTDPELKGILYLGNPPPLIDQITFPNTPADGFWAAGSNGNPLEVDFSTGMLWASGASASWYARCVEGP